MNAPLSPRAIARALGGVAYGNRVRAPGPGRSRLSCSLSIVIDPSAPDGLVVHDHAGDGSRAADLAAKDYVRERLGMVRPETSQRREVVRRSQAERPPADRTASALELWAQSRSPHGTPVETYLARRGLTLPDESEQSIRYHPRCPSAGQRTPAMVALVRDVATDVPKAIHRTAITLDGHKAEVNGKDRLALGPIAGGAVKITRDEDVTLALGVGEGIESTLSLRELPELGNSPVWSLLSAGGVAAFPVLGGIECLWLAVDHDPVGAKAARTCAARWRAAGHEVFLIKPKADGADLNDLASVRRRRHEGR